MEREPDPLAAIDIVLVEPSGPRNLGAVARVMKNMGLHQLILVDPHCDPKDIDAYWTAVHARDILDRIRIVKTLPEALRGYQRVIGTTGREQNYPPEWHLETPRQAFSWLLQGKTGALVFGPEDRGLSNEELSLCQRHVKIPTAQVYPSLNLAQAVGICCYELHIMTLDPEYSPPTKPPHQVSIAVMEEFYDHLASSLLHIGYLQSQTAQRKLAKFRALFNRAELTLSDIALLRGIFRQLNWAYDQASRSTGGTPHGTHCSH
jgi:tRNA/rRNA methyltransferase